MTTNFFLDNSDILLEAFDRLGVRPTSLTRQHMISATRSVNLALQTWSNRGVNLWKVDLQTIPLTQGVSTYTLPSDTVSLLDAYRRTYQLTNTTNQTPNFSTIINSPTVTINQLNNGLSAGQFMQVVIPVSIGGLILFGYYQIASTIDHNNYTITATSNATSTVSAGGAVPSFAVANGSNIFTCTLNNHGYGVGQTFILQVTTTVGGVPLQGSYSIQSVPTANTFTFNGPFPASSTVSGVLENNGLCQLNTQSSTADPIDQYMLPISRSEYASYADKVIQGTPTVYWFDRLSPIPTVTLWQPPNGSGPFAFMYYRMKRIQDAAASMGQSSDIPYLFLDALCADVANRLARKYAPALVQTLALEAKMAWDEAATENREYVDLRVMPMLESYWRI